MTVREKFRKLLAEPGVIEAAGAGDAAEAKLIQDAGFPAVCLPGTVLSMTYGMYDVGLLTLTEVTERVKAITSAIDIPLIADAEAGFGAPLHWMRTVREFEQAGAAAIHLEDMATKKGGGLIEIPEMTSRLKAALAARTDPNLVIIGRTDAVAPWTGGLVDQSAREEDALRRSLAYCEAGADAIMLQNPTSAEFMRRFCKEVPRPVMVTMGTWKFNEPSKVLGEIGIKIVLFPTLIYMSALPVIKKALADVRESGQRVYTDAERAGDNAYRVLLGRDRFKKIQDEYGA